MEEIKNSYDELLYKSKPFSFSVPVFLQSVSTLLGLNVADSKNCSFLELGSSFGGNMISQALFNPESKFVGIDLSEEQVKIGNEIIEYIGLDNIKLYAKNILDIDEDFGKFDYITTHGVYSWVPDNVKDKILEIFKNNLNENGIGYVSYNTYPGWKKGSLLREMMVYANKYYENLPLIEKVERSKAIINEILDLSLTTGDSIEDKKSFKIFTDKVFEKDNYYLAHEYLEIFNDPLYLHEFVDSVRNKGLEYVSDVNLRLSFISQYSEDFIKKIKELTLGDRIIKEQCIDYIFYTNFRKSLVCKGENSKIINMTESIPKTIFEQFYFRINMDDSEIERIVNEDMREYIKENRYAIFKIEDFKNKFKDNQELVDEFCTLLINLIISNQVYYSLNKPEKIEFEENVTYIPTKFIKYIELCISENNKYIEMADYFNLMIRSNLFNIVDLYIMQELKQPTTKEKIIEKVQDKMKNTEIKLINGENEQLELSEYFETAISKICEFNFFVK
ncbi:MAG: methyltransferase regulatory domain-containing protein [Streptobacillus sp.]